MTGEFCSLILILQGGPERERAHTSPISSQYTASMHFPSVTMLSPSPGSHPPCGDSTLWSPIIDEGEESWGWGGKHPPDHCEAWHSVLAAHRSEPVTGPRLLAAGLGPGGANGYPPSSKYLYPHRTGLQKNQIQFMDHPDHKQLSSGHPRLWVG